MNLLTQAIDIRDYRDRRELLTVRQDNIADLSDSLLRFVQLENEINRLDKVYCIDALSTDEEAVLFVEGTSSFLTDSNTTLTVNGTDYLINLINIILNFLLFWIFVPIFAP